LRPDRPLLEAKQHGTVEGKGALKVDFLQGKQTVLPESSAPRLMLRMSPLTVSTTISFGASICSAACTGTK